MKRCGKSRPDAEALVSKYVQSLRRSHDDVKERELQRRRAIEAHEAEVKRLREEAERAEAARKAELQRAIAEAEAAARRLRERRPIVHCFGGCERTAYFWSPCPTAPRQVGWVDIDSAETRF